MAGEVMRSPGQDLVEAVERGTLTRAVNEAAALIKEDDVEAEGTLRSKKFGVFTYRITHKPE